MVMKTALGGEEKLVFGFKNRGLDEPEIRQMLGKANNHLEMVKCIRPFFSTKEFHRVLDACEKCKQTNRIQNENEPYDALIIFLNIPVLSKSDKIAEMFLDKAKQEQKNLNNKMALRAHNLALSFAESPSVLGEVYRARSALLFLMKDFGGCILDINMARLFGYPVTLIQELRTRLIKCQIQVKAKAVKTVDPYEVANRKNCKNVLFRVEGKENEFLKGASNLIEIREGETNNRGVFATRSIPVGKSIQ